MPMDYEGFKKIILSMTTIDLGSYKEKQMKRRIDALIKKNGYEGYDEYIKALKTSSSLYSEFINYLTINVSEFYRNPDQWTILQKDIFPYLLNRTKNIKIWSAACSTGDEPYSLVMSLNTLTPLENIRILATDLDNEALRKAQEGIYSSKSLENLPHGYIGKYFEKIGESYRIKNEVKNCVTFKQHNLLSEPYPKEYDFIVCRNVLIYFTEEAKIEIYKNFSNALRPGGILFVGSTEQIIVSSRFNFAPIKTFFYQKAK